MNKPIPNHQDRVDNANKMGETMYGKNWKGIMDGIEKLDPNFAAFLKEIPYGSVYPRPDLSIEYREIAAITALTQLNLMPQLKSHILSALKVGVSKTEITELFLHLAMFIGFPLALDGLKVAKDVFEKTSLE